MKKIIAKLLLIYFKSIKIGISKISFFKNLLKQILRTRLKKTRILSITKLRTKYRDFIFFMIFKLRSTTITIANLKS